MKKLPLTIFLVALSLLGSPCLLAQTTAVRSSQGPGGIAAIVGKDVITFGDLDRKVEEQIVRIKAERGGVGADVIEQARVLFRPKILNTLIDESLLIQEAKRLKKTVHQREIDSEVNRRIGILRSQGQKIRDSEDFWRLLLENQNITREQGLKDLREEILVNKLLWTEVFPIRDFVTPGERVAYYRRHLEDFQSPSELTFRQIFIPGNKENIMEILDAIDRGLESRFPFEDLARQFSDFQQRNGGLCVKSHAEVQGWLRPLPEYLQKLKPGQVERRIRTSRGWHYLKMEKVKPGEIRSFDEVQEEIVKKIVAERRMEYTNRYVEKLKKRIAVQVFLPESPDPRKPTPEKADERVKEPRLKEPRDVSPDPAKVPAGQKRKTQDDKTDKQEPRQ